MAVGVERLLAGVIATTGVLGLAVAVSEGAAPAASARPISSVVPDSAPRTLSPELAPYEREAAGCPGLDPLLLVAIHDVETRRDPVGSTSSRGAVGPMQFLPSTWAAYGVDADGDGVASAYDLDDALAGATGYLCEHGVTDPYRRDMAIWNYNHSWTYVHTVVARYDELRNANYSTLSRSSGNTRPTLVNR